MLPVLKEVKNQVGESASIFQFDIDRYPNDTDNSGTCSVPTYIIFNNGKEMWRHIGELNSDDLVCAIEAAR
jgi:thioredoxin 1